MAIFENKNATVVLTKQWITGSTFGSTWETAFTSPLFVAEAGANYQVVAVAERHQVLGSTTVMLVGALGSTPLGSGTNLLASTINLASAVDIVNNGTLLGSAVLTGSSVLGTTSPLPVITAGDALGLRYGAANLPPVGMITVVLARL